MSYSFSLRIEKRVAFACLFSLAILFGQPCVAGEPLRVGIIGCDTSHVPAFTKLLNAEEAEGAIAQVEVVAFYPDFSPDVALSRDRVEGFTKQLLEMGIEEVDSVDELLSKVDAVLIENVDGRKHLEIARTVFASGRPTFVDKPAGGSLADVVEIFELAKKTGTPCFTSSSFCLMPAYQNLSGNPEVGEVAGCMVFGPCVIESYIPELFWYGIHSTDLLMTVMGPGCREVTRVQTENADLVVGVWENGNIGSFRGLRTGTYKFGVEVFGTKGNLSIRDFEGAGYPQLTKMIAEFFVTKEVPVSPERTLETYAFMEAAHESKRQGGKSVTLESVLETARAEVAARQ